MVHAASIPYLATSFTEALVRENGLDVRGFSTWFFYPGMEFGARETWWGDRKKRTRPHEGIDLCFYRGAEDVIFSLECGVRIPVLYDGTVVNIIDDFIGKTIIMQHSFPYAEEGMFLTLYGHTRPAEGLDTGESVKAGDVVATLAAAAGPRGPLAHLHLTLAWTSELIPCDVLNWAMIGDPDIFHLADPLKVIGASGTENVL